jgi:formylglycine-generating enzyme required for sulfatase activity
MAEKRGGGEVYEAGWVKKPGWTWRTPFGPGHAPADDEPAVHLTWPEAAAFCRWAGGRLPTDAEWAGAAYTEQRDRPPAPFERGRRYALPTGDTARGAQCLGDCGPEAAERAVRHGAALSRGAGHARTGRTPAGVNGLFDMGGNAWEWVDDPRGASGNAERRTRGGSWWYGTGPMQAASTTRPSRPIPRWSTSGFAAHARAESALGRHRAVRPPANGRHSRCATMASTKSRSGRALPWC